LNPNARSPRVRRPSRAWLGLVIAVALSALAAAPPRDDRYLTGYAAAVIERDLGLRVLSLEVQDGVARVTVAALNGQPPQWVADALVQIEGIERAEVSVGTGDTPGDTPVAVAVRESSADEEGLGIELLPRIELFDPLIADPRWPHIGVAYRRFFDSDVSNVGAVDFGETIPLLGGPMGDGRWEFGVLGGIFSIFDLFDLSADSSDLLNTDFWGGISFSGRWDWLSGQIRVYHQSSHLGDEFLLHNDVERVNVSYEAADMLLSADVTSWLRLYLGGGGIFHDTSNLDPGLLQAGFQLRSPDAYLGDYIRPIAGFDYQTAAELNWRENISIVAGFQIESPLLSPVRVQILGEFFTGNSPDGQFYVRRIKYAGVGAHLHF
jgi:Protein of unknown function (DUF1207)